MATAKVIIAGQNNIGPAVKSAQGDISNLSTVAQKTGVRIEALFIDEGFGTLSGEPLQNAINTLRSLHTTTGRQVGIISHIEELKERIPVQIQVNQEGNSSSSTVTVVGM